MCSHKDLWGQGYANIYANKGAMTRGVNGNSLDGFGEDRVLNLIHLVKSGAYRPKPCRRVNIPKDPRKPQGKTRPLGVPTGDDKIIQEVMRMLLEEIYEPIFSEWSYGFRPQRSCHSALTEIRDSWKGTKWVCDVDIKGYFDNIDHNQLLHFLSKRIDDPKFLKLIRRFLEAGYMEEWRFHGTHSGTPQGGIISPILANVYLHELDQFMANKVKEFCKGGRRKPNPEYRKLLCNRSNRIKWLKERNDISETKAARWRAEIEEWGKTLGTMSSVLMDDPDFKRLRYVRYADDFLIGVIGTKAEAKAIMAEVTHFVETELKLEISKEKSSIVDPKKGFTFLGYSVTCRRENKKVKCVVGHKADGSKVYGTKRTITEHVHLGVPRDRVQKFVELKGYGYYDTGRAHARPALIHYSDTEIVGRYNAELRGFANYYNLAPQLYLNKVEWIWQNSLFKTLAAKHRTSRSKIAARLKKGDGSFIVKEWRRGEVYETKMFKLKDRASPKPHLVDALPNLWKYGGRTELLDRLSARTCEYCTMPSGRLEVHHVRKLKDIENGTEPWKRLMIARRRKTLVVCIQCHIDLHRGTLPDFRVFRKKPVGEPDA
ncbi:MULTISPECIES: reverse transcriptase domain-containing protein [Aeromonas]|uniref:Maturase n=3 Tax=Aeromonadaceae TaxID=84642 RepID=A0AA37D0T2_AERCA|nr:reverse transcriptase domain-containing protein [Aeromonas caviae]GJA21165.1 maturase [Aeromonas caviae]GJA30040.1 maturase [Aeromonas caviae]GJA65352.1 maturase [Aeromonas caviae]GJA74041.1 maturase [Aeromonas caviae]